MGFTGKYGSYPGGRGYGIDFNKNHTLNSLKLAALKKNHWIDQDTRSIQILWSVSSAWS